jgi:hypothetical protein
VIEEKRYEFFLCYTNALKDFVKQLDEKIASSNLEISVNNATANESMDVNGDDAETSSANLNSSNPFKKATTNNSIQKNKVATTNRHFINGKYYTLEEVKELATKPNSEKLNKTIKERQAFSKKLFDALNTQECKVIFNKLFA